jgi:Mn2+/Fe2+ NRAMP family transporter
MGWMPAPIESSIWTSLWTLGRIKQEKYVPTLKETLIDFHIGYIGTAVLAVFFLTLGAMTMYGTGVGFSNNGTEFSKQVIELYTNLFGQWSAWIIAPAAFLTLFSSLLTCVDAYPRSLAGGLFLVNRKLDSSKNNIYFGLMVLMSLISLIIVSFLSKNLKVMMDLATVISFLAAPVFAIINYKIVTSIEFPKDKQPKLWLKALSRMGIVFLVGFSIIYIWTLFFLN